MKGDRYFLLAFLLLSILALAGRVQADVDCEKVQSVREIAGARLAQEVNSFLPHAKKVPSFGKVQLQKMLSPSARGCNFASKLLITFFMNNGVVFSKEGRMRAKAIRLDRARKTICFSDFRTTYIGEAGPVTPSHATAVLRDALPGRICVSYAT